jgi:surface polysaccharide O-acyltransferase-like enzyme
MNGGDAMTDRKHYLDNLRTFAVLMLLPQHTFMLFNNWGESWYIHSTDLLFPSIIKNINSFWMMPLLFTIAGISSRYGLERRSAGGYAKERVGKLFVPLVFGVLLIVPVQSFIAGLFWNGHAGYFDSFTKITDIRGYDGAFTVGQLWFLLYLFVIAMATLPFLLLYKKKGKGTFGGGVPLICLIIAGILPLLGRMTFDISGISPLEYLALFLLGYFFLTNEHILDKLDKYRFLLLGIFALGAGFFMYINLSPVQEDSWLLLPVFWYIIPAIFQLTSWLAVLALIGLARHYLNFRGKITSYLSKASFGVYMFHQSWIVVTGFFVLKLTSSPGAQYPLVLLGAIILTFLTYEITRRIPPLRWMFGLKKVTDSPK